MHAANNLGKLSHDLIANDMFQRTVPLACVYLKPSADGPIIILYTPQNNRICTNFENSHQKAGISVSIILHKAHIHSVKLVNRFQYTLPHPFSPRKYRIAVKPIKAMKWMNDVENGLHTYAPAIIMDRAVAGAAPPEHK